MREWCADERVAAAWDRMRAALTGLAITSRTYGFTQNDTHVANLVFLPDSQVALAGGEPGLTLVDVDVANFHWFASDVATALYSFQYTQLGRAEAPGCELPEGYAEFVDRSLQDGYRRCRDIDPDWLDLVQLFLQYRRCLLFIVFQHAVAADQLWQEHWAGRIQLWDRRLFG